MEAPSYKTRLIGRDTQLKFLKDKLLQDKVHLLQVYGQPCVGKSELVWEVLRIIKHELKDESFYCQNILVQENDSWAKIESKIFHFRNQDPIPSRVLVVLKDFHLISPEVLPSFQEFCCQMSLEEKMSVIIIHQRLPEFDIKGVVSEKLIVLPLEKAYANMLFCKYAFNSDSQCRAEGEDEYIDYLVDQCSGLPGLIINLACKWKEWSSFTSLAEFCEYFRKNCNLFQFMKNVICPQLGISKSFNLFFKYLPETLKKALAELAIFPGPLSINEMTYMIDESSELRTKFEVALPMVLHGLLKKNKEKFQVQPLIRDVASQQLYHMYNEDVNRLKFVHLIGNVLLKAEEIYRKNMPMQTLGIMKDNWDNIEFLLRKGIHLKSNDQTISVLFQVAVEAGDVISTCCPREAKEFFWDCLNASEKVGTTEQKAMMKVRYGQSLTNEGGAGGEKDGMIQYRNALADLKKEGKDFRTLCLLNSMAYNYYRQGDLQNACKCANEALELEVRDQDPEVANHVKINSASIYAYTLIYLGNYKKAKQILHEALANVGDSDHASISVMLNSLGLAEEGPNGNEVEALRWYSRSLSKRRKMSVLKPENLVIPLCHIADLASKTQQKYEIALRYLNEAKEIMKKKCWIHIHSATVQYTFGVVYLRMKSINDALYYFEDALSIHQQLHTNHYFNATILNWISHCHLLKDNIALAAITFEETRKMMAELIEMRPNACYLAQPLEHLVRMTYRNKQKMDSYQDELINELQRLVNFPGLDKTLISNYENILEVYEEFKNGKKCVLEKIPMTCTVCTEIKEHNICPMLQYKEKVNMVSYVKKLTPQRQPISNSNKYHHPPQIVYFSDAPHPPDPVSEGPSANSEDHSLCLWGNSFISDSNVQTTHKGCSVYNDSSTDYKDSDSKKCLDVSVSDYNSKLTNETKMSSKSFLNRPPLQLVEHSEESSLNISLYDSSKMGQSYAVKDLSSETNERTKKTTTGISNIIFEDQYREYESAPLQHFKLRSSCSPPSPQDGCDTRMMSYSSSGATKLNSKEICQNKVTERNPSNRHTMKLDHIRFLQNVETEMNRYLMERTTDPNSYTTHPGITRETDQNIKDQERLSHQHSSAVCRLEPKNTQNKTTEGELFIAHQNDARVRQQNLTGTFDQNSVSQSINLPNFHMLLADVTDKFKTYKMNFPNDVDETS